MAQMTKTITEEVEEAMVDRVPRILGARVGKILLAGRGITLGNGRTVDGVLHLSGKEGGSISLCRWLPSCRVPPQELRGYRGRFGHR